MRSLAKREKILSGLLFVVAVYYFIDRQLFGPESTALKNKSAMANLNQSEPEKDFRKYTRVPAVELIVWDGEWNSDPFIYPTGQSGTEEPGLLSQVFGQGESGKRLSLDGISWMGDAGYTIINGNILTIGDRVGGHTIEKIAADYVVLSQGTNSIRLTIYD